jgi:hypothetical protein
VYFAVFLRNLISAAVILDLSCSFSAQVSLPCSTVSIAGVLYTRNLVRFWTLEGFRTGVMMIPVICKNFGNMLGTSWPF